MRLRYPFGLAFVATLSFCYGYKAGEPPFPPQPIVEVREVPVCDPLPMPKPHHLKNGHWPKLAFKNPGEQ